MQAPDVEKSFCTTREAATLLGVSVATVQLWVESGLLQAWKTTGGHRRVLRESIDALLHKKPARAALAPPPSNAAAGPGVLRILVVEDDRDLLRLYQARMALWPLPAQITLADNAVSALLWIGKGGPDLLVADLQLPGMDGFAMLRVLHQAPEMVDSTVVVVTGLDAQDLMDKGGVPPGVEMLSKPIPFARLLDISLGVARRKGLALTKPGAAGPTHTVFPAL